MSDVGPWSPTLAALLLRPTFWLRPEVWTVATRLRKSGARMESRWPAKPDLDAISAKPGIMERQGVHPMRERAYKWCRAHPVEAAALPSWNLELLRQVLEGVV